MKIMKRYIVNLVFYSIVSLWIFSSCEDYDFKDIPDPVIPEDMTPGLKLSRDEIMIDAMGNAQGFELRSIGGGWGIEPIEGKRGDAGTLHENDCSPGEYRRDRHRVRWSVHV